MVKDVKDDCDEHGNPTGGHGHHDDGSEKGKGHDPHHEHGKGHGHGYGHHHDDDCDDDGPPDTPPPPCFTPGTLIATPKGEVPAEALEIGDRVITRDNGIQTIRWVSQTHLSAGRLSREAHLRPVRIRKGALGNGLPERDMMVSPNHRVLVANETTALYFEDSEVLVAAKHLTGRPGIETVETSGITYIHFMFDQHEVVLSDGAWTESFQPGDQTLGSVADAQRREIFDLFPELETREGLDGYQAARRSLKKHEAQLVAF